MPTNALSQPAIPDRPCVRDDEEPEVTELTNLTIAEARDGLAKKSFSAAELAQAHLDAMEKARALNAYVLETPQRALSMAKVSDEGSQRARQGRWRASRSASRTCSARKG